jgi:hypothetical protein
MDREEKVYEAVINQKQFHMDRESRSTKAILELAEENLRKKYTKEESLQIFIRAGILDKDGNFTAPYQNLAKYVKYTNR